MEPHRSLGCAQSQVTLDHLVKGVGDMRGGSSSSSSGPGSQASTPIESSSSNGAHHDAKAISPEHLKALWQQVAQQRAEAAARVRARREQYGGIVREEGISRWLPFLGSRGRPTAQKQHGGRRLLQMQVEGEGSVSQGETAMSMERRALLAESNPVDQIAAAAAVWRAYYHSSLTQWQHMPHGISNATLVRADMFANNRNDSYVFAWPEKSCTGKVCDAWILLHLHLSCQALGMYVDMYWYHPRSCGIVLLITVPPCPACSMTTMACHSPSFQ